jgi:four helix bundle protein
LERAAVSVSNNIAEGFERGTTKELLMLLYIARGSAGEVRSMLHLVSRIPRFSGLSEKLSALHSRAESISRQLRAWADSLQNTDIKGHRYLTDKVRREQAMKQEQQEFEAELRRAVDINIASSRIKKE